MATHEVAHITEGTVDYAKMALLLDEIAKDSNAPVALKAKIGDIKARREQIGKAYAGQMKNMNFNQREYLVDTELTADLAGLLLGDEYFINKLAERNLPLVKKIFNGLKALATRGRDVEGAVPYNKNAPSVDRESAKYLSKLVNKFGRAINKSQGGVDISLLGVEDKEKERSEETGIRFSKSKNEYPYDMQKIIEGYINSVDEKILNQAELQRKNKNTEFKRLEVCTVDSEFVNDIADLYNMDISGFTVNINSNGFNHIEKRHGKNGEADRSMANLKDLARLGFVIENRDSLEPLTYKDEQVYSKEFRTKAGTPAPMMLIKKKINGTYYCAIAVTDAKYSKVWVQTAFINKRDGLTQILHDEISSLSLTSETVTASHPSNNSISENGEKINSSDEKISNERFSKPKGEKFMPGRYLRMTTAEELVEGYDADMISAEEALKKLNVLGLQTDITIDNALDTLREFIPEIREFAASEREAYRESNKRDTSSTTQNGTSKAPSPTEGAKGDENVISDEEYARREREESWSYWQDEVDRRVGSVKYLKNGKVKVKLAQTANEVRLAKFINNNIMGKAYTNQDVKSIIDKVLTNSNIWGADDSGSYMAKLKGEDLSAVKKQLWAALNTAPEGERIGPALDIADYIVKHGILTEIIEVSEDVYYAQSILDALEPYKQKIDISHIEGDIKAKFDTDRTPFGLWAQKKSDTSRGYTADEVGQALEEVGIVLNGDRGKLVNEADIFIAMHDLYTMAQSIIKNATPGKNDITGAYNAKEIHELKQKIASEIMHSYEQYGQETTFSKAEKKYKGEIASLKKRVKDVHEENRLKNAILYEAQKIKDSKAGKYYNATQVQDEALKGLKSLLGGIKYRSDLNRSSTRAIIKELANWYTEDNPVLQSFAVDKQTSESRGLYSPHIKALIDLFLIEDAEFAKDKIVSNFGSFSEKEIANYNNSDKISVAENDQQIKTFIDDSLDGKNNGKKLIVGKLSEDLVDKIKKSTEVDLQGFNFELRADALMHMKKHHGNAEKEANRGQVPVDTNAVLNAIEVVTSFDTVEKGKNDNSLVFTKNINGVYHVVTYYAYGNKSIYPHTLYITKKDGLAQTNNANENNSYLARNVQDDLSTATNSSITENDEIVKAAEEKRAQKAQKPLDTTELGALNQILHHMNFVFESYGKIWRGGKRIEAKDVAKKKAIAICDSLNLL